MTITRRKLERAGWVIFIASAICYTWAGLRAGDLLSTTGSLLFLIACFFFLAPGLLRPGTAPEQRARS